MKIEIHGYEGPSQMRAFATLLETLAGLAEASVAKRAEDLFYETHADAISPELFGTPDGVTVNAALHAQFVHVEPPMLGLVPPPPPPSVELDSAGQEWNADLHSSSKAFVADGTWRKRRNVAMPPPPSAPDARVELPIPPPPASTQPTTFAELMDLTQGLLAEKKITPQDIMAAVIECGLPSMAAMSLPENARLIPTIAKMVIK